MAGDADTSDTVDEMSVAEFLSITPRQVYAKEFELLWGEEGDELFMAEFVEGFRQAGGVPELVPEFTTEQVIVLRTVFLPRIKELLARQWENERWSDEPGLREASLRVFAPTAPALLQLLDFKDAPVIGVHPAE
jgi:hypothetical protein